MSDKIRNYCCPACFNETAIAEYIEAQGERGDCEFCEATDTPIMHVDELIGYIDEGILRKYERYEEHGPWESAEGGPQWPYTEVHRILVDEEVLSESALDADTDLLNRLCDASSFDTSPLIEKLPFGNVSDHLNTDMWETFSHYIKHASRFEFLARYLESKQVPQRVSTIPWSPQIHIEIYQFLDRLGEYLTSLTRVLEPGEIVYRGRRCKPDESKTCDDLTAPPPEKAKHNRMSPDGISYFYGCNDRHTCLSELRLSIGDCAATAAFRVLEPLQLLDLTSVSKPRSMFDEYFDLNYDCYAGPFLESFCDLVATPVNEDDARLEYLPTQMFCSLVKDMALGVDVHAIKYRSATHSGGSCYVIFRGEDISDENMEPWLKCDDILYHRITGVEYRDERYIPN